MPIADNPDLGYPLGHWGQVREIIITAAEAAGFDADMVSNDAQVDIIHSTIIKNIYNNDVAVCDVSTRNPNVMFELGLRIASKKPVILIKDEATPYSFDTQLIPHVAYRRDLRMFETLAFQKELKEKIATAYQESQQAGYMSFLGQFTSYTLAQIDEKEVGAPEYIAQVANRMQNIEDSLKSLTTVISRQALLMPTSTLQQFNLLDDAFSDRFTPRKYSSNTSLIKVVLDYMPSLTKEGVKKLSRVQRAGLVDNIINSNIDIVKGLNRAEINMLLDTLEFQPF